MNIPTREAVVVDTSALYALVDRRDPNHLRAATFLRAQSIKHNLLISNHVFDEAMTLCKMRLGHSVALQLGMRVRTSELIEVVLFGAEEEMATWRLFGQYRDKEWSYTDCASFVLAQQRKTVLAFSFDHHFSQMGLKLVA